MVRRTIDILCSTRHALFFVFCDLLCSLSSVRCSSASNLSSHFLISFPSQLPLACLFSFTLLCFFLGDQNFSPRQRAVSLHEGGIYSFHSFSDFVASSSKDSAIVISQLSSSRGIVPRLRALSGFHAGVVKRVRWQEFSYPDSSASSFASSLNSSIPSSSNCPLLSSCGNDKTLCIFDIRGASPLVGRITAAHSLAINSVCWSPLNHFILCSASFDKVCYSFGFAKLVISLSLPCFEFFLLCVQTIKLWDIRFLAANYAATLSIHAEDEGSSSLSSSSSPAPSTVDSLSPIHTLSSHWPKSLPRASSIHHPCFFLVCHLFFPWAAAFSSNFLYHFISFIFPFLFYSMISDDVTIQNGSCVLAPSASTAFVSVYSVADGTLIGKIPTGGFPVSCCTVVNDQHLLVANARNILFLQTRMNSASRHADRQDSLSEGITPSSSSSSS